MTNAFEAFANASVGQGARPQGNAVRAETDSLTGNNAGYDPLFSTGESRPSVLNKSHEAGDRVTGVISDAPFDKQSRFMDEDEAGKPVSGDLKWWGEDNKPTSVQAGPNGARKPVMDTVVPLKTEYRDRGQDDTGSRAWYVGGKPAMDALRNAIAAAGLTSREQMVGMTLTVERTGKAGRAWLYKASLSK